LLAADAVRAKPMMCYNSNMNKTGRNFSCLHCETSFYLRGSEIKKGGGVFCSIFCRKTYKALHSKNYLKVGRQAIHRIVAEKKIGRPLLLGETVHHIDGNKLNNHPDNLVVLKSHSDHMRLEYATGNIKITHDQAVRNGKLSVIARRLKKTPLIPA